jgi:hypothetical protein
LQNLRNQYDNKQYSMYNTVFQLVFFPLSLYVQYSAEVQS